MMEFETSRILMRRFKRDDLEAVSRMESNIEVMKYTGPARSFAIEESKERLEKILKDESEGFLGYWAAIDKESNTLMAWFMLIYLDEDFPELGFMLNQDYWGKGFASEIGKELCKRALPAVGKIIAKTNLENKASIAVLQKTGFQQKGQKKDLISFEIS